jgi:site-specific DNA-adenine methylase
MHQYNLINKGLIMSFNEYEVYQIMKRRKEEIERKARDAWKYEEVKRESFFQKVVKKWNNRENSITIPQQNCCACHC